MSASEAGRSAKPLAMPPTPAQMLHARATLVLRQARDPASPVPSPCSSVCRMDAVSGLCQGCWRTLEEIRAWSRIDDVAKLEIWRKLKERSE